MLYSDEVQISLDRILRSVFFPFIFSVIIYMQCPAKFAMQDHYTVFFPIYLSAFVFKISLLNETMFSM